MLTLLALLCAPAYAQAVPSECDDVPVASCIDPAGSCLLDTGGGTLCYPLSGNNGRIELVGGGDAYLYTDPSADPWTMSVEELRVSDSVHAVVHDDDPDDDAGITFASESAEPSIEVDDADLFLEGVHAKGSTGSIGANMEGSAIHVADDGLLVMTGGTVTDGRGRLGAGAYVAESGEATFIDVAFANNHFHPLPQNRPDLFFKGRDIYSVGTLRLEGTSHAAPDDQGGSTWNTYGGAVYVAGDATIGTADAPSTFNNYVADYGGTIAAMGLAAACNGIIVTASFFDATAGEDGGGVYVAECDDFQFSGEISSCSAISGGALYPKNTPMVKL